MINTKELTIKKAHEDLISGKYTAVDLAKTYLENIKKSDKEIHSYLEVFDDVIEQAKKADERIAKKDNITALTGIPISVKDVILIKGRRATGASKILENYTATYDATVVKKLKDAGVVFLGKVNCDEFAMGGSTENSAFGATKNPLDLERVPGGSSGGSAASVAGDMSLASIGSDTGGSIRQPASFCGLVGLKPTYGAVSRYGLMAMASSFDSIGPITKTVEDAKIIFDCISGKDEFDSTSVDTSKLEKKEVKMKMIIGVPKQSLSVEGMDEAVLKSFNNSLEILKKLGFEIKEVSIPSLEYSLPAYYTLVPAEVSSNMARLDGVRYGLHIDGENSIDDYFKTKANGFGSEVKRRIILGTYVLSSGYYDAYYNKANIVRDIIRDDFKKVFEEVDFIITPTTPSTAFKIGEKINDPLQLYLEDIFTVPVNLVGVPAISIPYGFKEIGDKKLPLGIQFIAPHFEEKKLLELGKKFLGEK